MAKTAAAHRNTKNCTARNGVVRGSQQTTRTTATTMAGQAATTTSYY
jgi:hypothetical protein